MGIKSVKDLKVYNIAFELAMEIFKPTLNFPKEERYSLTDQISLHQDPLRLISVKDLLRENMKMCS